MDVKIRPSTESDIPQLLEIYNYHIENGHSTFQEEKTTIENMLSAFKQYDSDGPYRMLVAEQDGKVVGRASSFRYRDSSVFDKTVETGIYLSPDIMVLNSIIHFLKCSLKSRYTWLLLELLCPIRLLLRYIKNSVLKRLAFLMNMPLLMVSIIARSGCKKGWDKISRGQRFQGVNTVAFKALPQSSKSPRLFSYPFQPSNQNKNLIDLLFYIKYCFFHYWLIY